MTHPHTGIRIRGRRQRLRGLASGLVASALLATPLLAGPADAAPAHLDITGLQTENLTDPIGIDAVAPLLSWQEQARGKANPLAQTAYQVRAATSVDQLTKGKPDLWDSGRVPSAAVSNIAYQGAALSSREHVFWQVRVWTGEGDPTAWSSPASFEMGLLGNAAWSGKWIENPDYSYFEADGKTVRPLPVFAKGFATTGKKVASARLYMTGLGLYSATVDGKSIGKAVLEPGQTTYADEVQYRTYDVTKLIKHGSNEVAVQTGNGTYQRVPSAGRFFFSGSFQSAPVYGTPKVIAQLEITYADGTHQTVASDSSWRTTLGDTTFSSWWSGEDYNASRLPADWESDPASLTGSAWTAARPAALSPTTTPTDTTPLVANPRPPVTVVNQVKPQKITPAGDGSYILDFGVNRSGWPVLSANQAAGTTVKMTPAELLNPDGSLNVSSTGASATSQIYFSYTFGSGGKQTWHPQFTYEGFRYLKVDGLTKAPTKDTVTEDVLTASNPQASTFDSSSAVLNQIHTITEQSIQNNMMSVMTDCPDREKGPYTGDNVQNIDALLTDFDMSAFEPQLVKNMATAQRKPGDVSPGLIANIAPEFHRVSPGRFLDEVNWGGAIVIVPWELYQNYGDVRTMNTYYQNMVTWMDYEAKNRADHNGVFPGLGDWSSNDSSTPLQLPILAGYYRAADTMSKIATVLGKTADATKYADLAAGIKTDFNQQYRQTDGTRVFYGSDSEASDAVALDFGLVSDSDHASVVNSLVASVAKANNGITTGSVALGPLFRSLHAGGRDDVIYSMVTGPDKLTYASIVAAGHTTLPENLNGSGSQDHQFLGQVDAWFVNGLAGISQAPGSVGWSNIDISPAFVGDLTHASGSYNTPYGTVSSSWTRKNGTTTITVTVPTGANATLSLDLGKASLTGTGAAKSATIRHDGASAHIALTAGSSTFTLHQ